MMRPAIFAGIFLLGLYPRHELPSSRRSAIRQRAGVEYQADDAVDGPLRAQVAL